MKSLKIYARLLIVLLPLVSCENLLEPENDNHSTIERIYDPGFAEGILINAYVRIPTNSLRFNDVATDDAVTSNKLDNYLRMATGQWSAMFNPVDQWENSNSAILYINQFLDIVDTVQWKWSNSEQQTLYRRRFKGEAYALKGLFEYQLLQSVGGIASDNNLLGIPLYNKFINIGDNFNVPRAGFAESVAQIYADFDKALEFLTMDDYKDITLPGQLPAGIDPNTLVVDYNAVFGKSSNQRISGRIVKALRARLALMVASPAFSDNDPELWKKAADYAAVCINGIGGLTGLDPYGHRFYEAARVDAINLGAATPIDQKEIMWRTAINTTNSREKDNYPPSLYGNGRVNPSQNLVDAFPGLNGYPITDPRSLYNPANPYAKRDPRLALYVVYNGNKIGSRKIYTGVGGGSDAKDSIQTSTRTGYYLRKLIREDVNLNPVGTTTKKHYEVHIRYTELFLNYAEAANEAWGPTGVGSVGSYSAKDVIAAIRKRAGITQPDAYLNTIATKESMRELIRNERRLELCFEGFRFWDLRRWKANLTETAKGIHISGTHYTVVDVEQRLYQDYMYYGPLPSNEVLKYNALLQNNGW